MKDSVTCPFVVSSKCGIYGLLDWRKGDIFYIGSTFDLHKRLGDHLRKHPYLVRMRERGLFPIPLVLLESTTRCDLYSRMVEIEIALQLRMQGHSAFGDDTIRQWMYPLVEEQAHQFAVLCEIWKSV